MHYTLSTYK